MNNPTSSALLAQDGDIAQRRGELYPTRGDFIVTEQDRQDWSQVVYDIITHKGTKPGNIQTLIAQRGTEKSNLLRNKTEKGGRRSLGNILICLIRSYSYEKVTTPTASDVDRILHTIEDCCAPVKTLVTVSESTMSGVRTALGKPHVSLMSGPVIAHRDRRRAQVNEVLSHTSSSSDGDTAESLPNVAHFDVLTKGQKVIFLRYYGYRGEGYDPSRNDSYDVKLRKTCNDIAAELDSRYGAVYQQLWNARKRIYELNGGVPTLDEAPGEEALLTTSTVVHHQKSVATVLETSKPLVKVPGFLNKDRKIPTPIPKSKQKVPLDYSGKTTQTSSPAKGAVVVAASRPIPQRHVYIPPSPSPRIPSQNGKTNLPRAYRPTSGNGGSEAVETFDDLVNGATEVNLLPGKPKPTITPESADKRPREIPQFTSYRVALIWGQEQNDWAEIMHRRESIRRTPLTDDLFFTNWLIAQGAGDLLNFLGQLKSLAGKRITLDTLMDTILTPLPEEDITLEDIQRNPTWMEKIQGLFQRHEAGDYAGFIEGVCALSGDKQLSAGISNLVPEYKLDDILQVLALIVEENWTPQDMRHYSARTPRDIYQYTPEANADLDRILGEGAHVKTRVLISALQDITIKAPVGVAHWLRYQEYKCPKVTLYDFVVALMKQEGGDTSSSKAVFHKLQEILGVG